MASENRQERALQRLRGAGSRQIANADFGFDFGFGNKGIERQRDVVPRTNDNAESGLQFSSSARSLRSHGRTPRPRRSGSRQPSRTPGQHRPGSPVSKSNQATPAPVQEIVRSEDTPRTFSQHSNAESSKRRRLSTNTASKQILLASNAGGWGTHSVLRDGGMFLIAEDEDMEGRMTPSTRSVPQLTVQANVEPSAADLRHLDKENDGDLEMQVEADTLSGSNMASDTEISKSSRQRTLDSIGLAPRAGILSDGQAETHVSVPASNPAYLKAPAQGDFSEPKKRKKRKKVVLRPQKRRSSGPSLLLIEHEQSTPDRGETRASPKDMPSTPEADQSNAPVLSASPSDRQVSLPPRAATPEELDDEADETYVQEDSPEAPTPGARDRTNRKQSETAKPRSIRQTDRRKSSNPTFPILTHRLTNVSSLPTIHEDDEQEAYGRSGELLGSAQLDERSQPNAVNVLAQICRETIANLIESLSQKPTSVNRAAFKNKRAALEAFGEDLDEEFFLMSEAVESRVNLDARVRKSRREKASLQAEYTELRKQREQVALRCDTVRSRHWECEAEAREKFNVSEAARRAELDIQKNNEALDENVEFLSRNIAGSVSCRSDAGGILDSVKSFNARLETMALVLEKR